MEVTCCVFLNVFLCFQIIFQLRQLVVALKVCWEKTTFLIIFNCRNYLHSLNPMLVQLQASVLSFDLWEKPILTGKNATALSCSTSSRSKKKWFKDIMSNISFIYCNTILFEGANYKNCFLQLLLLFFLNSCFLKLTIVSSN